MEKINDNVEKNTEISAVEPTVMEPEMIAENSNLASVKGIDWIGLSHFTETYARTLKDAYIAGLEAGRNNPQNTNNVSPSGSKGKNAEFFCAVADDKAYAVYTSEEKIRNQTAYWNKSKLAYKDFGKGQYEEAVAWATAEVSKRSGVAVNQLPPLRNVNYYTKVK